MINIKPRSILQLTIIGFLTVTGILILALVTTARQLDGLSDQSQRIVSESTTAMNYVRTVIEQTSAMERNARQFEIIRDGEILKVYGDRRQRLIEATEGLSSLSLGEEVNQLIRTLISNEAREYALLLGNDTTGKESSLYPQLLATAYRVSDLVNQWSNSQLAILQQQAAETRYMLTMQAVLLVSIAVILAGFFTALITRPLMQVERAIGQIGKGAYEKPVSITGPTDIVNLGQRLEWLRDRLEKLEHQRSLFLHHVSHELKTPLAAMQESALLLKEGVVGTLNTEQEEILNIQEKNCQRLQSLINDLLKHNAENFAILNVMPEDVRLDKLIENVVQDNDMIVRFRGQTVVKHLDHVTVRGHPEQLRVVIDNLLMNAVKFSPEQSEITLRLKKQEAFAQLDIQDQGPGIEAEEAERIFEGFYQGAHSDQASMPGHGLGLAIVKEYLSSNGGSIEVMESKQGAHFRLLLPLASGG